MTYEEAIKEKEKYLHLVGTRLDKTGSDHPRNLITHLVVAPYNATTGDVADLVAAYNKSNEAALKMTGNSRDADFRLFVVAYSAWDNIVGFWLIDRYLAQ